MGLIWVAYGLTTEMHIKFEFWGDVVRLKILIVTIVVWSILWWQVYM